MNKTSRFLLASSLVLLAFLLNIPCSFGQIPKLFFKFVEAQNKIKSGYIKLEHTYIKDNDTTDHYIEEAFFILTPKDFKFLTYRHLFSSDTDIYCKSAHTEVMLFSLKEINYKRYRYNDQIYNAKDDISFSSDFSYTTEPYFSSERWENCLFQRIPPEKNPKNIRYKIIYPDDDITSDMSVEWEFDRKNFRWTQVRYPLTYFKTDQMCGKEDILEQRLYDYIHPDILDTISFKYEELKKGYDKQYAAEQAKKDSVFRDSIIESANRNGAKWVDIPQETQQDTLFFMPEWKFPSLSGDTIYSDSIKSQYLFIDMWYVSCHPCRMALRELASIDTLYNESLIKFVSLNVSDTNTAKMKQVVENLNLKSDIACVYGTNSHLEMTKKMGTYFQQGHPQLYLIDMKTKQVIWSSLGWYEGFTKEIGALIMK